MGGGRRQAKENDYENEERSRAEEWPTEYTEGGRDPEAEGGKLA